MKPTVRKEPKGAGQETQETLPVRERLLHLEGSLGFSF